MRCALPGVGPFHVVILYFASFIHVAHRPPSAPQPPVRSARRLAVLSSCRFSSFALLPPSALALPRSGSLFQGFEMPSYALRPFSSFLTRASWRKYAVLDSLGRCQVWQTMQWWTATVVTVSCAAAKSLRVAHCRSLPVGPRPSPPWPLHSLKRT